MTYWPVGCWIGWVTRTGLQWHQGQSGVSGSEDPQWDLHRPPRELRLLLWGKQKPHTWFVRHPCLKWYHCVIVPMTTSIWYQCISSYLTLTLKPAVCVCVRCSVRWTTWGGAGPWSRGGQRAWWTSRDPGKTTSTASDTYQVSWSTPSTRLMAQAWRSLYVLTILHLMYWLYWLYCTHYTYSIVLTILHLMYSLYWLYVLTILTLMYSLYCI